MPREVYLFSRTVNDQSRWTWRCAAAVRDHLRSKHKSLIVVRHDLITFLAILADAAYVGHKDSRFTGILAPRYHELHEGAVNMVPSATSLTWATHSSSASRVGSISCS